VVDAYARRILGWRVASTMATSMVLDAIEQSIWTRQQEGVLDLKDVVHHTDRAEPSRIGEAGWPAEAPGWFRSPTPRGSTGPATGSRFSTTWTASDPPMTGQRC